MTDTDPDTGPDAGPDAGPAPFRVPPFRVIIPANDEAGWIDACLEALLAQEDAGPVEVIVAANACADGTEARAAAHAPAFAARGWRLDVLSILRPGKLGALDAADAAIAARVAGGAAEGPRAYLDADVVMAPEMLAQLRAALDVDAPRYATGTIEVAPARTLATRAYARVWARTPFVRGGAVGAGLFAVNPAGRARAGTASPTSSPTTPSCACASRRASGSRCPRPTAGRWSRA